MSEAQQETAAPEKAQVGITFSDDDVEQSEPVEEEKTEEPEAAAEPEDESEAAEDDGDDDEAVAFDERQQKKLDKIIARNSYRYKTQIEAEQRQRQELEQRLQALERGESPQESPTDPETGAPVIPDFPDPFDSDYEKKLEQRDAAIRKHASWEAEQIVRQEQQAREQQQHIEALNKRTEAYIKRGKDFGLTSEDIQKAGEFINQAGGIPVELIDDILDDEAGPAIPQYLYKNPEELQKVQKMSPIKAARYIESNIRPKAVRIGKRKAPPPPVQTESGAGAKEQKGLAGATYE